MPRDEFDPEKNTDEPIASTVELLREDFFYELGDQLNFDMGRHGGFCYGIACMIMQATLANELPALKARLVMINSLTKEEIDNLVRKARANEHESYTEKETDILAFYEGVSIYQNAERRHSNLFEKYDWSDVGVAAGLIAPINLQDRYLNWKAQQRELTSEEMTGPIASACLSTAIFTKPDFVIWLSILAEHLRTASISYPLSICLNNYEHTIQLSYDIENYKWIYTSGFEIYESSNAASIADVVFKNKSFSKNESIENFNEPNKLVLTSEFFVPTQQLATAKIHLNNWSLNEVIQAINNRSIHDIDDEQVENLSELFYLAISSGNVSLLNSLLTNEHFLSRQSLDETYGNPFIIAARTSCSPAIMIELLRSDLDRSALILSEHPASRRALNILQNTVVDNLLEQLPQIDIKKLCSDDFESVNNRMNLLWMLRDIWTIHQNQQLSTLANETFDLLYQLPDSTNRKLDEAQLSAKLAVLVDLAQLTNSSLESVIERLTTELTKLSTRLDPGSMDDNLLSTTLVNLLTSLRSISDKLPKMVNKLDQITANQLIKLIHDVATYQLPEKQKTEQLTQQARQLHGLFQRKISRDPRTTILDRPPRTLTSKN